MGARGATGFGGIEIPASGHGSRLKPTPRASPQGFHELSRRLQPRSIPIPPRLAIEAKSQTHYPLIINQYTSNN